MWGIPLDDAKEEADACESGARSNSPSLLPEPQSDTAIGFWNYFQYGIDFLISQSGIVIKIILHSNIVCAKHVIFLILF